jgi:glycosyltransferase involved in cell wall biosynthesis
MRVLFITNRVPFPLKDGGNVVIYNTIEALKSKHSISLLSLNTSKHFTKLTSLPPLFKKLDHFSAVPINTNLNVVGALLALLKNQSYNIKRFYSRNFDTTIVDFIKTNNPKVVQLEGLFLAPYIDIIRKHSSAKIILRAHNVEHVIWEELTKEAHGLKRFYLNLLAQQLKKEEVIAFNKVDVVACLSKLDKVIIEDLCKTKCIAINPLFKLPNAISYVKTNEITQFGHIGAMDWLPNKEAVETLISSIWPFVFKKHPKCTLHLAGKSLDKNQYKSLGVINYGEVDSAESFMSKLNVLVVPLSSGSGIRIKILEAMAIGKIVIASPHALKGLNVSNNVEVLISTTPEEFIKNCNFCIENTEKAQIIGKNGQKWVQIEFNREKIVEDFNQLYLSE